jgi:hypothetical protein
MKYTLVIISVFSISRDSDYIILLGITWKFHTVFVYVNLKYTKRFIQDLQASQDVPSTSARNSTHA